MRVQKVKLEIFVLSNEFVVYHLDLRITYRAQKVFGYLLEEPCVLSFFHIRKDNESKFDLWQKDKCASRMATKGKRHQHRNEQCDCTLRFL